VAKYDGWHGLVVFEEHHPLRFTEEQVGDYLDTAQAWAMTAHQTDPTACYPFFLWNCLWRSGASILHGHAQVTLTQGMHYARVESWRQASHRFRATHGVDYFPELIAAQKRVGLAISTGTATILPSLTPFKERETLIIDSALTSDLKSALYRVLRAFVDDLGVRSFNVGIYQPPLADTPEPWKGFPWIARILDRGSPYSKTVDIGAMEIFGQSVVTTDPYRVAEVLGGGIE
jgi:galactose-1-phosphate uridylyltransferase